MALANDPRRVGREPPPPPQLDASRKRTASRSPQDGNRPSQKLARSGTGPNIKQNVPSLDPRKASRSIVSPGGSRRPSVQTDGDDSTFQAGPSPVASIVPSMGNGIGPYAGFGLNSHQNDLLSALMACNVFAAELASIRNSRNQALAKKTKAEREFQATEQYHAEYPPTKEQHTNARNIANVEFSQWEETLRSKERSQEPTMAKLVKLLLPSRENATPITDTITRTEHNKIVQDHKTEVGVLLEKLTIFEKRIDALHTVAPDTSLTNRLDTLESAFKAAEALNAQHYNKLVSHVNALDTKVEDLDSILEKQQGVIAKYVEGELETTYKSVRDEVGNHRKLLEDELSRIHESFSEANSNNQLQVVKAIDNCSTRLDHTEAQSHATKDNLNKMQKKLEDLGAASKQSSVNADGLLEFQPIMPDNIEPAQLTRLSRLENQVMALQNISNAHEKRLNNTTTNALHDQIVDSMRASLPWTKDLQVVVENINGQLRVIQDKINALDSPLQQLEKSMIGQEVGSLRKEYTMLSSRVEKHENKVVGGEKEIGQVNEAIKTLQKDVMLLQTAVDTAISKIPLVQA